MKIHQKSRKYRCQKYNSGATLTIILLLLDLINRFNCYVIYSKLTFNQTPADDPGKSYSRLPEIPLPYE